ncbi:hypothetical protein CLOM_g5623 [Closterium sp. NIES-68]|nr:hypothetical protein CLOM_g5623 [Closterium sp. NIES-68]
MVLSRINTKKVRECKQESSCLCFSLLPNPESPVLPRLNTLHFFSALTMLFTRVPFLVPLCLCLHPFKHAWHLSLPY